MSAYSDSDAKLLSDLHKFAASAGIPFPGSQPSGAEPPKSIPDPPSKPAESASAASHSEGSGNAAIDRCLAAYAAARKKARAAGKSGSEADSAGKEAYLRALPPLVGSQNVGDFIACVMRGSIENVIFDFEINKFLYAAQVANCVKSQQPAPKRRQGRPRTTKYRTGTSRKESNASVNTNAES